jgi:hypothetical protein
MPTTKQQETPEPETKPEPEVQLPTPTGIDNIASAARMKTATRQFWTTERKEGFTRLAIENGSKEEPNYTAAMKLIWTPEAKAEFKAIFAVTPVTG